MSIKGLRAAVEAVMTEGVTVDTLPALLSAAGEGAGEGEDAVEAGLPEGFRWEDDDNGHSDLIGPDRVLWATVRSGGRGAVWHGGDGEKGQGSAAPLRTLAAARAWAERTLFGPRP